jgi:hypothetical protein
MNIRRLLYNPYSSIVISVILGFGLATLFRKSCSLRGCYVFKGPSMENIEGKTFQMGNKCYQYDYQHQPCNVGHTKIIEFARTKNSLDE